MGNRAPMISLNRLTLNYWLPQAKVHTDAGIGSWKFAGQRPFDELQDATWR